MLLSTLAATLALLGSAHGLRDDWGPEAEANPNVNTTLNQAIDYSLGYVTMGRFRAAQLGTDAKPGLAPYNGGFYHDRNLVDAKWRDVTTPNTDTLYTRAMINLSKGPANITFPNTDGRYYSMALLDMASNDFYVGGRRRTGTNPTTWIVVGPNWEGRVPADQRIVRAPCDDVLVAVRMLVDGKDDQEAVWALQDQMSLTMLNDEPVPRWDVAPPNGTDAAAFVDMANLMLTRAPPPPHEKGLIDKIRPYGICGAECSWAKLPEDVQAHWKARLPEVLAMMRVSKRGYEVNGWSYAGTVIGDFGSAYYNRAQTAVSGFLVLPNEEAMYPFRRQDADGNPLTGDRKYRLTLPSGVPQVRAFWSLTVYDIFDDGSQYFTENEINRYAIGDRTPGLVTNEDGSIDLWIQSEAPTDEAQRANWLPTPKEGDFSIIFRAYEPGSDFRDHRAPLPQLITV